MNLLRLHTDPQRRDFFANPGTHFVYDEKLRLWGAVTREATRAVLRSKDWIAPDFASLYESLTERLGHDFSLIRSALKHTPLANNGDVHRKLRRRMALHINTVLPAMEDDIPGMVSNAFAPFQSADRVEMMDDCVNPLVREIITRISGVTPPRSGMTPSRALDALLGMGKRLEIEEGFRAVRDAAQADADDETALNDDALGFIFALHILARDTMTGSIGESLHTVLSGNDGAQLCAINWPADFIETSVSYVERCAMQDTTTLSISFPKDTRMRTYFPPCTSCEMKEEPDLLFGAGAHVCLGKRLARTVWTEIARYLSTIERQAHVRDYSMRAGDFVFAHPDRFTVELS